MHPVAGYRGQRIPAQSIFLQLGRAFQFADGHLAAGRIDSCDLKNVSQT